MKVFSSISASTLQEAVTLRSNVKVCMHVRGVVRLDARVIREATTLVDAKFDVSVVDIESERTRPTEEDLHGIRVRHIRRPDWLVTPASKFQKLVNSVLKLIVTTYHLVRIRADIYHAHDVNALLPCYIAAQLHRKSLILDAHEMPLYELDGKRRSWTNAVITRLFVAMVRRCSGVITVSQPIIQELYKRYHIAEVTLLRNIPPHKVVPKSDRLRRHLGLDTNVRIVLYQGNLQPDRGLDRLIRAAAFLEPNVVIVLMGKVVGSTSSDLEALAIYEQVADRIKIIPPVPYEELLDWTGSADIGVSVASPDYSLNVQMFLPNKLFEYLMAGLPILSSPLAAMEEIIKVYGVGTVLSSLEPSDIATAINTMLADQLGLQQMRHNALEAACNDLCWEKESQQLIRLYNAALMEQDRQHSK